MGGHYWKTTVVLPPNHPPTYFYGSHHCIGWVRPHLRGWQTQRQALAPLCSKFEHAGNNAQCLPPDYQQHCTSYNVAQVGIVGSVFDDYPHQATQPSAFMIAPILFLETIIIPNIVGSVRSSLSVRVPLLHCSQILKFHSVPHPQDVLVVTITHIKTAPHESNLVPAES